MGVQSGTFHAAIVTGSAAGLGLELVRQLLERGWFVCGVDFDAERMAQLDREFETTKYRGFVGDVTDEDFVRQSTAATRGNAEESVYCAAKWGERGYTESLKAAYKGSGGRVIGVYPGGIDTDFYRENHDYVPLEKQHTFMRADELAHIVLLNLVNDLNLTVSDIRIDRNPVLI